MDNDREQVPLYLCLYCYLTYNLFIILASILMTANDVMIEDDVTIQL